MADPKTAADAVHELEKVCAGITDPDEMVSFFEEIFTPRELRDLAIRVEADEVTYNMHIFLRFEIENLMLDQKVAARDLPELWNAKMVEYLGVRPENDTNGVLQDVHWAGGMLGYFPTYSLGNLLAAQFYAQALAEMPDLPEQFERGEFSSLLAWLRANIHAHGNRYTPAELVQRITGGPIRTEPFLDYVRQKYTQIYQP